MKNSAIARKISQTLQNHISMSAVVVGLILLLAASVFFVNTVIILPGTDDDYKATAEKNASLINFDTSSVKSAEQFSNNQDDTSLPSGRINPFASN